MWWPRAGGLVEETDLSPLPAPSGRTGSSLFAGLDTLDAERARVVQDTDRCADSTYWVAEASPVVRGALRRRNKFTGTHLALPDTRDSAVLATRGRPTSSSLRPTTTPSRSARRTTGPT
ncbi:hypothetical protein [Streptomyces sp. NPDC101150]|uniref:hypothetical protein n=1 Tax=Streptomyces sp. NPDC101150 TaxID=3366114 RepID=UPI0038103B60